MSFNISMAINHLYFFFYYKQLKLSCASQGAYAFCDVALTFVTTAGL